MKQGVVKKRNAAPLYAEDCNFVDLSPLAGPRFLVTIDTEEEFDWNAPFSRDNRGTEHTRNIPRFQALCEEFGVKPAYMIDWPIIDNAVAADMFGGYASKGTASIGLHLHPWVTPPDDEEVNDRNSYACNLPPELERAKLVALSEHLQSRIGVSADIYRAGRYGAGVHTPQILSDLGFRIDSWPVQLRLSRSPKKQK